MAVSDHYLHDKHMTETLRMPSVLLGVSSAAIGFAFHETKDQLLSGPLTVQLVGILLWAGSFTCGVLFSRFTTVAIRQNIVMNMAEEGNNPEWKSKASGTFDKTNKNACRAFFWQQVLLLSGAAMYLAGHVWLIADRTKEAVHTPAIQVIQGASTLSPKATPLPASTKPVRASGN